MELYFWVFFSMIVGFACGMSLGFVIWGLDNSQDRDIPTGDDW